MWVGNPELEFEKPISAGTVLGQIFSLYGDLLADVCAPDDGVVFGLRSRPAVLEGDWCCFFGIIDETRRDLIPG
jgi:predicted deacylase